VADTTEAKRAIRSYYRRNPSVGPFSDEDVSKLIAAMVADRSIAAGSALVERAIKTTGVKA
jgi:hypothetical protein